MLLLENGKAIQNQSAFMHIWLRGQRLGTDRFDDETKTAVLQVSICMYPVRLERRLLCDIGVRRTPSNSEILSVPEETFYFYN